MHNFPLFPDMVNVLFEAQNNITVTESTGFQEICLVLPAQPAPTRPVAIGIRTVPSTASGNDIERWLDKSAGICFFVYVFCCYFCVSFQYTIFYAVSDFQSVNQTLTFQPGETRQCINITITMDGTVENLEVFSVVLFSVEPLTGGTDSRLISIEDSDSKFHNDDV